MPETDIKTTSSTSLKPFLVPGLILILVVVSAFLVLAPKISQIDDARQKVEEEQARLARLTAKVAALEALDRSDLIKRGELVVKALPAEKNVPFLLVRIRDLSAETNLRVESLEINPGELATDSAQLKKEKLPMLSFDLEAEGEMTGLKNFLKQLAKMAPLTRIENLVLDTPEGRVTIELVLDSPFLSLPESLGASDQPLSLISGEEEIIYQRLTRLDYSEADKELPSLPAGKPNPFVF